MHAAVDVAAPVDRDRVVEAGNRARRGNRVGEVDVGMGSALAAECDAATGGVVARHHPQTRVRGPAVRDDAAHSALERLGRDDAARQPPAQHRARRVPARVGEALQCELPRPRADRRRRLLEVKDGTGGAVGLRSRPAVGVQQAIEGLAAGVRHHEPGRHAGGTERSDHRAGGGADDVVGGCRVPAGLPCKCVEAAGEPSSADHPARAKDKPNSHLESLWPGPDHVRP